MSFAPSPNLVTLNLFQGPSLGSRWSGQDKDGGVIALSRHGFARAARWVPKQVQHDEEGKRSVIR